MAKKRKIPAKRQIPAKRTLSRSTSRQSNTSLWDGFSPTGWFNGLIGSQTGRVIAAKVLVAAAGAAAAVLVASRTEAGAKAGEILTEAGRNTTELMKEAGAKAAAAATEVLRAKASEAISGAAKQLFGDETSEASQQELAEQALRMRQKGDHDRPRRTFS